MPGTRLPVEVGANCVTRFSGWVSYKHSADSCRHRGPAVGPCGGNLRPQGITIVGSLSMFLLQLLLLLVVAGICGAIGQAIVGYSHGGMSRLDCVGLHRGAAGVLVGETAGAACRPRRECGRAALPGRVVDRRVGFVRGYSQLPHAWRQR